MKNHMSDNDPVMTCGLNEILISQNTEKGKAETVITVSSDKKISIEQIFCIWISNISLQICKGRDHKSKET